MSKIYRNQTIKDEGFPEAISMDDIEDGTTYGKLSRKYVDDDGNLVVKSIQAEWALIIGSGKPADNADITSSSPQDYSWVTGTKPPTNADNTAGNAQNVAWLTDAGAMAYEDMVEYAKLGNTVIVGGYIKTSLLTASNIVTGILTGVVVRTGSSGARTVITGNDAEFFDDTTSGSGNSATIKFKRTDNNWGSNYFGIVKRTSSADDYNNVLELYATALASSTGKNYIFIGRQGSSNNSYVTVLSLNSQSEIEFGIGATTTEHLAITGAGIRIKSGLGLYFNGTTSGKYIKYQSTGFEINHNIHPDNNNNYSIGTSTKKFHDVQSTLINGSDYGFENGWWITESYKLDIKERGLAILNKANKLIAFIGEKGFYSKKHFDISELKYTLRKVEDRIKIKKLKTN